MEIKYQELRQRYRDVSTDALLQIKVSSDLTDMVKSRLEEEASKRNDTLEDIRYAKSAEEVLRGDRESEKKDVSRRIRRLVIIVVVVALMAIYFAFFQ